MIFRQNSPEDHFYIIMQGEVNVMKEIVKKDSKIDFIPVSKLYKGQYFGDGALKIGQY